MRRTGYRHGKGRTELPMTPMIDVIFLLIIFFLCTSNFQPPEEVLPTNLSLPGAVAAEVVVDPLIEDLDEVVVKLHGNDEQISWEINRQVYHSLAEVRAVLAAVAQVKIDLPVILDVDRQVPLEHVIDVYDLCRQIGLARIQFAASAEEGA